MSKIKKLLQSIGTWLRLAVSNTVDFAEDYAPKAVLVTEKLKTFLETNGAELDQLVKQTETTKDDELLAEVLEHLPGVARTIADANYILDGTEDDAEVLKRFGELVKGTKTEGRAALYVDIAASLLIAVITKKAPGASFPKWLAVTLTQIAFGRLFKKA